MCKKDEIIITGQHNCDGEETFLTVIDHNGQYIEVKMSDIERTIKYKDALDAIMKESVIVNTDGVVESEEEYREKVKALYEDIIKDVKEFTGVGSDNETQDISKS